MTTKKTGITIRPTEDMRRRLAMYAEAHGTSLSASLLAMAARGLREYEGEVVALATMRAPAPAPRKTFEDVVIPMPAVLCNARIGTKALTPKVDMAIFCNRAKGHDGECSTDGQAER